MHFRMPVWAMAVAATLFVAAACGGSAGVATPPAPSGPSGSPASVATSTPTKAPASTSSATPTAASTPSAVDLSAVDACTLLDERTLQELTGTSLKFTTSGSDGDCFYGATTPEPPYVDISVFARPDGLAGYTFNASQCSRAPVAGVGTEAFVGPASFPLRTRSIWSRGTKAWQSASWLTSHTGRSLLKTSARRSRHSSHIL